MTPEEAADRAWYCSLCGHPVSSEGDLLPCEHEAEVERLRALVAHLTAGCTEVGCPVCLDAKAECGEAAT